MPALSASDWNCILQLLFLEWTSRHIDLSCIRRFRAASKVANEWFETNLGLAVNAHLRTTKPFVSREWLVSVMQTLDAHTMDMFVQTLHAEGNLTYDDEPDEPDEPDAHYQLTDPNPLAVAAYAGASADTLGLFMQTSHHRHYPCAAAVARYHRTAAQVCQAMVEKALAPVQDKECADCFHIARSLTGVLLCPGLLEAERAAYVRELARDTDSRSRFYRLVAMSIGNGPYDVQQRAVYAAWGEPMNDSWGSLTDVEYRALCGFSQECAASVLALPGSWIHVGCDANMLETAARKWSAGWFPLIWEHYSRKTQDDVVRVCRLLFCERTPYIDAVRHIFETCPADIMGYPFADKVLSEKSRMPGLGCVHVIRSYHRHLAVSCMLAYAGVRAFVAERSLECKALVEALYRTDYLTASCLLEALPKECLAWRSSRGDTLMHVACKRRNPDWRLCVNLLPQELLYVKNDEGELPDSTRD